MRGLKKTLKRLLRKRKHLKYLERRIWYLKYEILNDALEYKINKTKIKCFHKYNKRLKLITFLRGL